MFRRYLRGIITANILAGTSGVYDLSERFQYAGPYDANLLIIAGAGGRGRRRRRRWRHIFLSGYRWYG